MIKISSRDVKAMSLIPVRIKNTIIMCEYAKTQKERETGLMFRIFMAQNSGMLFDTFNRYRPVFYMKNTIIPLEAVFIDTKNKIVDIIQMKPLDASTIYTCWKNIPIKHVLELNQHYCSRHQIKIGDLVFFD